MPRGPYSDTNVAFLLEYVQRVVAQRVGNKELAVDVGDEVRFALEERICNASLPRSPKRWIRAVVQRTAHRLAKKRNGYLTLGTLDGFVDTPRNDSSSRIRVMHLGRELVDRHSPTILAALTARQRKVYREALSGASLHEIARRLSLYPGDVQRLILAAARRIRRSVFSVTPTDTYS